MSDQTNNARTAARQVAHSALRCSQCPHASLRRRSMRESHEIRRWSAGGGLDTSKTLSALAEHCFSRASIPPHTRAHPLVPSSRHRRPLLPTNKSAPTNVFCFHCFVSVMRLKTRKRSYSASHLKSAGSTTRTRGCGNAFALMGGSTYTPVLRSSRLAVAAAVPLKSFSAKVRACFFPYYAATQHFAISLVRNAAHLDVLNANVQPALRIFDGLDDAEPKTRRQQ